MSNKTLTAEQARELTQEIKSNLVELEKNLRYFHALQGWLPLGYDSFTVWWDNEMRDIPLAIGIRNWAVFAMIEENTEGGRILPGRVNVIAHATKLAPTTITAMKHKNRARNKTRILGKKDDDPSVVTVVIPTRWHRHFIALSVRRDEPMTEFLRPILKDGMMRHYGIDLDKPVYPSE